MNQPKMLSTKYKLRLQVNLAIHREVALAYFLSS